MTSRDVWAWKWWTFLWRKWSWHPRHCQQPSLKGLPMNSDSILLQKKEPKLCSLSSSRTTPWCEINGGIFTVSFGWALYQECPCAFVISWFPRSEVTLAFPVSCLSTFQLNASERGVNRVLMPIAMIGGTEHENYNRESFIHEARLSV